MKKRGRQIGADGEKSRELLLKIAAKQFSLLGFHDTKISAIVKEANVTQPTFYLYFKSKDAIFQELIDLFKVELFTRVGQSRLPSGIDRSGLLQRITRNIALVFQIFQENEHVARIGFFLSADAIKIKEQMAKRIEENLAVEVENGYFDSTIDINLVATAIVGVIEHLTLTKLWAGLKTPEELSKEVTRLFLYGLIRENKINGNEPDPVLE